MVNKTCPCGVPIFTSHHKIITSSRLLQGYYIKVYQGYYVTTNHIPFQNRPTLDAKKMHFCSSESRESRIFEISALKTIVLKNKMELFSTCNWSILKVPGHYAEGRQHWSQGRRHWLYGRHKLLLAGGAPSPVGYGAVFWTKSRPTRFLMTMTCWITSVMDPSVPFILMLTIAILICIFFLLAALHGRPESKRDRACPVPLVRRNSDDARMLGTPLVCELPMCWFCVQRMHSNSQRS